MKNLLLFCFSFFLVASTANAQTYSNTNNSTTNTLMGVRIGGGTMGSDLGLTIQHQLNQNSYLEGLGTLNKYDVRLTGLYEYHQPLSYSSRSLTWFVGGGVHVGKVRKSAAETFLDLLNIDLGNEDPKSVFVGLDAIGGIQYKFPGVPLNASIDIKPAYNFNDHPKPFEVGAAFSLRWHFGSGGGKGSSTGSTSGNGGYGTSGGSKGGSQSGNSGDGRVKTTTPPINPSPQTQPQTSPTPSPETTPQTNPSSPKAPVRTKTKTTPTQKPTPTPKPSGDNDGAQDGKGSTHGESWEDPPKDN
ncbi:MAG: hypothetical protein R3E32_29265 [Chitinophagales bacterium]